MAADGQPRSDSRCPRFVAPGAVGRIENDELIEVSGLAASRKSPGVLWVNNDSGNPERVYALAVDGRELAEFDVLDVGGVDWEDIAIGPGPAGGESYLYIADVGTNVTARDVVVVNRIPEPDVKPDQAPARGEIRIASAGRDAGCALQQIADASGRSSASHGSLPGDGSLSFLAMVGKETWSSRAAWVLLPWACITTRST
jgi:hypothetical protein